MGGSRIAVSYLATVLGWLLGGLAWAAWAAFGGTACAASGDELCQLGWLMAGGLLCVPLGWATTTWVFRLGWEWWAVSTAAALGVAVLVAAPLDVLVPAALLIPALAGAATWTGPVRTRRRPWLIGAASLAIAAACVASVLFGP